MKNQKFKVLSGIMMFLCLISLVSAPPPVQETEVITKGLQLEAPIIEYIKVGESFDFHVHAHNVSTGMLVDNTTTECIIHLYSGEENGEHIVEADMGFCPTNLVDFEYEVEGGNFTDPGEYAVLFYCEANDEVGGFIEYGFMVTPTGSEFTVGTAILYSFVLLLLGVFLCFTIYGIKYAENVAWLIGYICATYVALYLIISVLWILSTNYLYTFPALESIFWILWLVMGFGFLPFVFVVSLYVLGKEAQLAMQEDLIRQGYSKEEAKKLSKRKKYNR